MLPPESTSRDYNKAAVLDVVLSRARVTRNELIELTGLSKATVSRAVEALRPGDTLLIHEGTYTGVLNIRQSGRPGLPITIRAAGDGPSAGAVTAAGVVLPCLSGIG